MAARRAPWGPRWGLLLPVLAWTGQAMAAPHIPADGRQVVERLPSRADPVQRELRRLRAALDAAPADPRLAGALARRYIERARIEGDPRYLGYAQAALAPWWRQAAPPDPVPVLRATLRQSTHQFPAALADLDLAVRRNGDDAQAWLTRATVQTITGNFIAARASCAHLLARAPAPLLVLIAQTCLANVGSVSGQAAASYRRLSDAMARHPQADPGIAGWVETALAEMAARLGRRPEAESHFRRALALGDPDSYLLGAWADFLLDAGRAPEVIPLLKDKTRVDALLLRYALALRAVGAPDARTHVDALRARFDAAMLRGDTVHQREQARFELALLGHPQVAVRLAKANWQVQKDPADLRILAQAARAAGDADAMRIVRDWLRASHLEDSHLDDSHLDDRTPAVEARPAGANVSTGAAR